MCVLMSKYCPALATSSAPSLPHATCTWPIAHEHDAAVQVAACSRCICTDVILQYAQLVMPRSACRSCITGAPANAMHAAHQLHHLPIILHKPTLAAMQLSTITQPSQPTSPTAPAHLQFPTPHAKLFQQSTCFSTLADAHCMDRCSDRH